MSQPSVLVVRGRCLHKFSFLLAISAAAGCETPLVIDAVEPAETAPGGSITIRGAGFDDDTTFALTGPADVALAGEIVDEERATATVPDAAPAGLYALRAESGARTAEKSDALTVIAGTLTIAFLDVGQGDATLVIAPTGETLLIDGGRVEEKDVLVDAIDRLAGRLDGVIVSHFDADHLGGVVALLAGDDENAGTDDDLDPEIALAPSGAQQCDSLTCGALLELQRWPFDTPSVGDALPLGDVDVTVVAVDGDVGDGAVGPIGDDNERSIVPLIEFGGRKILVLGDLTGGGLGTLDVETPLANEIGVVDVLRTAHHGSATSSNAVALDRLAPALAIVSVGTDNAYCHPEPDAWARIVNASARVLATGAGIVDDVDRCGAATIEPGNADLGRGEIVVTVDADGTIAIDGEPL